MRNKIINSLRKIYKKLNCSPEEIERRVATQLNMFSVTKDTSFIIDGKATIGKLLQLTAGHAEKVNTIMKDNILYAGFMEFRTSIFVTNKDVYFLLQTMDFYKSLYADKASMFIDNSQYAYISIDDDKSLNDTLNEFADQHILY